MYILRIVVHVDYRFGFLMINTAYQVELPIVKIYPVLIFIGKGYTGIIGVQASQILVKKRSS